MFCGLTAQAAQAPQPPCGSSSAYPPFAEPGAPPNIRVWRNSGDLVSPWIPSGCTGWAPADGLLVALAGQFRFDGNGERLLGRFGAISTLQGIRDRLVSHHQWRTLITHASALDSPDLTRQRADFTTAEMKRGRKFYFAHDDNRTSGEVIYRLRVRGVDTGTDLWSLRECQSRPKVDAEACRTRRSTIRSFPGA